MPGSQVRVVSTVTRLARQLRTELDREFAEQGLTSPQAGLLVYVLSGISSPRRLADLLDLDAAAVSRLIDRLVAKELLVRVADPTDRRAVTVELTAAGQVLAPQLPGVYERVGRRLTRGLDAADLADDLERMAQNLR